MQDGFITAKEKTGWKGGSSSLFLSVHKKPDRRRRGQGEEEPGDDAVLFLLLGGAVDVEAHVFLPGLGLLLGGGLRLPFQVLDQPEVGVQRSAAVGAEGA